MANDTFRPVRIAIVGPGNVGATYYAVAADLVRIVEAIVRDENSVLSISSRVNGIDGLPDVCLSMPTATDSSGVGRVLRLPLDETEKGAPLTSARALRQAIESAEL